MMIIPPELNKSFQVHKKLSFMNFPTSDVFWDILVLRWDFYFFMVFLYGLVLFYKLHPTMNTIHGNEQNNH